MRSEYNLICQKRADRKRHAVLLTKRDPLVFEAAAWEVGFMGFGHCPRSGFLHIDLGPVRASGELFPRRPIAFTVETT